MKRKNIFKAGMTLILLLMVATQAGAADPDSLYIRYIEGGVELAEAGSSQWMAAAINTPLVEGDTIRTTVTGRAELFVKDGSIVRIGKSSSMKITAVEQNGVQMKLNRGMTYVHAKGTKEVPLFFDTPTAALDITGPATFRMDVYDNGISEVSVYNGTVYAAQQKGRMPVKAGERLVLGQDGRAPVLAGLRSTDDWQRWNAERDRAVLQSYAGSESYAYLPEELRTYSTDLDTNGQWVYTEEYNYVWVPTVITVSTWSPYRFGRWVWIRGSYVWIGYEPWGWAPYHYGRWAHHRHAGWCWVPPARGQARWAPAHVAWVHSSKHVGWVPLAPGETYDHRRAPVINQRNSGDPYRNMTIDRSINVSKTVYRNAGVNNAVVAVNRDRLVSHRAMEVNVTKSGGIPMKKVNLPPNVVPARAKNVQPGGGNRMPASQKPAGVTIQKSNTSTAKVSPLVQAGEIKGVTRVPTVRPLKDRIENSRPANVKEGQPGVRTQSPANPVGTTTVRNIQAKNISLPLRERIANNRPSMAPKTIQTDAARATAASRTDQRNQLNTQNANAAAGTVTTPPRVSIQGEAKVVTARPVRNIERPAQPAAAPASVRQTPSGNKGRPDAVKKEDPPVASATPVGKDVRAGNPGEPSMVGGGRQHIQKDVAMRSFKR